METEARRLLLSLVEAFVWQNWDEVLARAEKLKDYARRAKGLQASPGENEFPNNGKRPGGDSGV